MKPTIETKSSRASANDDKREHRNRANVNSTVTPIEINSPRCFDKSNNSNSFLWLRVYSDEEKNLSAYRKESARLRFKAKRAMQRNPESQVKILKRKRFVDNIEVDHEEPLR